MRWSCRIYSQNINANNNNNKTSIMTFSSVAILLTKMIGNVIIAINAITKGIGLHRWDTLPDVRLPCQVFKSLKNVFLSCSSVLGGKFLVLGDRSPIQSSSPGKENLLADIIEMSRTFRCGWDPRRESDWSLDISLWCFLLSWLYSQAPRGAFSRLQAFLSLWLTVFLERKFLFPNSLDRHYGIDSSSLNRTMCPHRKQSV